MKYITICLLSLVCMVQGKETVYVLHGYLSHPIAMHGTVKEIERHGFDVVNYGYNSVTLDIRDIATQLKQQLRSYGSMDTIHFVTHSMGGLVVRALVQQSRNDTLMPVIDRIVMLTPPNKGSELADFFSQIRVLDWILGPNLDNMTTDTGALWHTLSKMQEQRVGIIAGMSFRDARFSPIMECPHDGKVTVSRAMLNRGEDRIIVKQNHRQVLFSTQIRKKIVSYLTTGSFQFPPASKTDVGSSK